MMATVLEWIVSIGIFVYGMRRFLVLRKYWQFRHEQVVTESISVVARVLSLCAAVPFLIKFVFVDKNIILTVKEVVDVIITTGIMLIGMGVWAKGNRERNPLKLLIRAVQQERKEALHITEDNGLRRALSQIVQSLKLMNRPVSEPHTQIIDEFVSTWQVTLPTEKGLNTETLVKSVADYIELHPPVEHAAQLKDFLSQLLWEPSRFSETIYQGVEQLQLYLGNEQQAYEVVVVPQNEEHHERLQSVTNSLTPQARNGGVAYVVGQFYSKQSANSVSLRFVHDELFSTVEPI